MAEKRKINALKRGVADTARRMFEAGLVTSTWGNVSGRLPDSETIVITPSGLAKGLLSPRDVVVLNLGGRVVEGKLKPSLETPMHIQIYCNRPDVNGVVHTHSPYATSFAIAGVEIPVVSEELAAVIGGSVPVAEYATFGTEELGRVVVRALGKRNAVLLQNHGVVAVGPTLSEALRAALVVENAAKVVLFASLIGKPIEIPPEDVDSLRKAFLERYPKLR